MKTHTNFSPRSNYELEPYSGPNSRFTCPACNKPKEFTRYFHVETREYIHEFVGICNRIDKCGYHYKPKEYFASHTDVGTFINLNKENQHNIAQKINKTNIDFIDDLLFQRSLKEYQKNTFTEGLKRLFGVTITQHLISEFHIGTANNPDGATIFWQVDTLSKVRTGKIITYDPLTLLRKKSTKNQSVIAPSVDWVHSRLKREGKAQNFSLQQCLFGLHQLADNSSNPKFIGIVESEKTAIVASVYFPNLTWMAAGGANLLNFKMLEPLKEYKVILFPDVNQYTHWKTKGVSIKNQLNIDLVVSDFLERTTTPEMKETGADLADVLIKRDNETGLALTDSGYPVIWNQ